MSMDIIQGIVGSYILATYKLGIADYRSAINLSVAGYCTGWKVVKEYDTQRQAGNGHYELTLLSDKELASLEVLEEE